MESEHLVDEEKYDDAYSLMLKQKQLGSRGNFASLLINYYKALVSTFRLEDAKKVKLELIEILKRNLRATPKDCETLGRNYKCKHEYIKAILFYQAAEGMLSKPSESEEIITCLMGCSSGLHDAATSLIEKRPDLRCIVADDIVPAMRRIYDKLSRMMIAQNGQIIQIRSLCLYNIEKTELIAEDNTIREKTLREAIGLMENAFGEKASEDMLYCSHVMSLAAFCLENNKAKEANKLFRKAIKCRNEVKDERFNTEDQKNSHLESCMLGLRKSKEMLNFKKTKH